MLESPAFVPDERAPGLEDFTSTCNERLLKAGAGGAEQSFGLGCALGGLPLVGGVLALYIFGAFPFIMAVIIFVLGALVLLGLTTLISFNAKKRSINEIYRKEIGPEIQAYILAHAISEEQLNRFITSAFPDDAPLRNFHSIAQTEDENSNQE